MITVGVDPGAKGAFVLLVGSQAYAWSQPMQYLTKGDSAKGRADFIATLEITHQIALVGPALAVLEEVGGIPGKTGAATAFNFGRTAAAAEFALSAANIPFRMVPPQKWEKHFGLKGKSKRSKDDAFILASRLLPAHRDLWTPKRGTLTTEQAEGVAEAALMALYARTLVV